MIGNVTGEFGLGENVTGEFGLGENNQNAIDSIIPSGIINSEQNEKKS